MNASTLLTRRALAALFACCFSLLPALSGAATLTVMNTNGDDSAGSLRKAIEDASTISGADTIIFDASLSGQTIRLNGMELTIDSDLIIDASALPDGITISGDQTGDGDTVDDSRVFFITGTIDVTLISLNITGGRAGDGDSGLPGNGGSGSGGTNGYDGSGGDNGGGIYSSQATLTLKRCAVAQNRSGDGGDGGAGGNASGGGPGGDGNVGGDGGGGGGIYSSSGTLTLQRCTVAHNRSGDGGSGGAGGNASVSGNGGDGGGNSDGGGNGGGIHIATGTLTLEQCTVAHNRAGDDGNGGDGGDGAGGGNGGAGGDRDDSYGGHGGGIYSGVATLTLQRCTFAHNRSGDGGAGGNGGNGGNGGAGGNGGDGNDGGGIFRSSAGAALSITDSIIAGNLVGTGGDGSPGIDGSDGEGPDLNTDTNTTAGGINLIGDNTLNTGSASTLFPAGPFVGTGIAPLDALLGPLADNGGPTETLIPLRGSPALNPSGGAAVSAFPTDQRGSARIVGGIIDIGAVEAPDYAAIDAANAAAATAAANAAAAAKAAQQADLSRKLKKLKKKFKNAKRKKQVSKAKNLKKKIKKLKKQLRAL